MKIKIDQKASISIKLSDDKEKVVLSTQVESVNGHIFLNTISLNEDSLDTLLTELITLKSKLQSE